MAALTELLRLTHAGITTDEFDAVCRRWLASAQHPRFARPYPQTVYQPMLELLRLLARNGFSCWIFSGGGTDFMRAWASGVYGLPPYRVIGSAGGTEFRIGNAGPSSSRTLPYRPSTTDPQAEFDSPAHRAAAGAGGRVQTATRPAVTAVSTRPDPATGHPAHRR
jgi:hypothetical protein